MLPTCSTCQFWHRSCPCLVYDFAGLFKRQERWSLHQPEYFCLCCCYDASLPLLLHPCRRHKIFAEETTDQLCSRMEQVILQLQFIFQPKHFPVVAMVWLSPLVVVVPHQGYDQV